MYKVWQPCVELTYNSNTTGVCFIVVPGKNIRQKITMYMFTSISDVCMEMVW